MMYYFRFDCTCTFKNSKDCPATLCEHSRMAKPNSCKRALGFIDVYIYLFSLAFIHG